MLPMFKFIFLTSDFIFVLLLEIEIRIVKINDKSEPFAYRLRVRICTVCCARCISSGSCISSPFGLDLQAVTYRTSGSSSGYSQQKSPRLGAFLLRVAGLEPARRRRRRILSPLRLPIPPYPLSDPNGTRTHDFRRDRAAL